eukprot:TRINITY_DN11589_c0_g1_i1.p1 TRINITY_DN11589_c0_g1~~TRINITY_DN11589_c0_g1_i1.p1  ORF type:complete len:406 (+),score=102.40 TRINITY_DN11589_c0_g1_i1:34-1218(+)
MTYVLTPQFDDLTSSFIIPIGRTVIGRKNADIIISQKIISTLHCTFNNMVEEHDLILTPKGRNGTTLQHSVDFEGKKVINYQDLTVNVPFFFKFYDIPSFFPFSFGINEKHNFPIVQLSHQYSFTLTRLPLTFYIYNQEELPYNKEFLENRFSFQFIGDLSTKNCEALIVNSILEYSIYLLFFVTEKKNLIKPAFFTLLNSHTLPKCMNDIKQNSFIHEPPSVDLEDLTDIYVIIKDFKNAGKNEKFIMNKLQQKFKFTVINNDIWNQSLLNNEFNVEIPNNNFRGWCVFDTLVGFIKACFESLISENIRSFPEQSIEKVVDLPISMNGSIKDPKTKKLSIDEEEVEKDFEFNFEGNKEDFRDEFGASYQTFSGWHSTKGVISPIKKKDPLLDI